MAALLASTGAFSPSSLFSADAAAKAKEEKVAVAEKSEDGEKAPVDANKAAMLNAYEKAFHSL